MNWLIASPCWLALFFKIEKSNKWLWALLKLLAICKWLNSNIWSILLLLFPKNITYIIISTYLRKIIFTVERISGKMYLKASWSYKDERRCLLSYKFFILYWCINYQSIKYLRFSFCCITFLAWRWMILPTGAENTPENENKM